MSILRRGSARKHYAARRLWLSAHPDRYERVPGINDDVTETGRLHLDLLHEEMRTLGLFGQSPQEMQRETIRRLVSELRGEYVEVGW